MIRVNFLIDSIINHIDDGRFKLEQKITEDGISFKASFYHDYFYVDKETRVYSNTEINLLETFCGAMLDDIAEAIHYVFDCHALKENLSKDFLNELEEKIRNERN